MNYIGNRGGVPLIDATLVTAGTDSTNAVYSIPNHTFRFIGNAGIVIMNFSAATTTATGITLLTNNSQTQTLTNGAGAALTTVTAGLHLVVFNKHTNTLSLIA